MSAYLEGMTITQATGEEGIPVTSLEGDLIDQTALAGVLNSLYEMHLTVLSVKCLTNLHKSSGSIGTI